MGNCSKYLKLFSFFSQIKYWLSESENTKCLTGRLIRVGTVCIHNLNEINTCHPKPLHLKGNRHIDKGGYFIRHKYTDPHFQRKMFQEYNFNQKRGLAEIIVPLRGYGRHSANQVMIKRE